MLTTENITLHTFQTSSNSSRRFITGLTSNEGTSWEKLSRYKYGNRKPPHNPPLIDFEIEVPTQFGERLLSFYETYLSSEANTGIYNCHRFALWMIGSSTATSKMGYLSNATEIQHVMHEGQITQGQLKLGKLGIVGYLESTKPIPYHSVIGLGEQPETIQCIQIAGLGGRLTVSSCNDATNRYYSEGHPQGVLYAIPESN